MIDKPEVRGLRRVVRAALIERERLANRRRHENDQERLRTAGYLWLWDRVISAGIQGLANLPDDDDHRRSNLREAHAAIDVIFRQHSDTH